ncbi:MAG TPA: DUF4890 domain-containing protein [Crocinitomix sp.]|nr:DUF4890 domain-containing protein [Crocinitomix sp.]
MKNYLKKTMTTLTVGFIIALTSPVIAQEGNMDKNPKQLTAEERAQKRTDKMTKQLELTEEQAKKVYEINLEHVKKMDALKAERKAQNEKTKSELDKVLTEKQKKKAEELRQKRKEKQKSKR